MRASDYLTSNNGPRLISVTIFHIAFHSHTRGYKFWSSKVCEGGESRGAYACRLNFDPPQFPFEINDYVTKTHFWSAFKLIENLILIQFELMKVDQNWVFEQFESGSKVGLSHVIINFEEKLGWIKSESACICSTWLTSFTYFTGSNVGPSGWKYDGLEGGSERSKAPQVNGPGLKWTVQNDIKWTVHKKWNWTALKSALVVKKEWTWTV